MNYYSVTVHCSSVLRHSIFHCKGQKELFGNIHMDVPKYEYETDASLTGVDIANTFPSASVPKDVVVAAYQLRKEASFEPIGTGVGQ